MQKEYKVLKKFGDLKKGAIFVPEAESDEELQEAIDDGFLIEVTGNEEVVVAPEKSNKISKVTFQYRSPDIRGSYATRVFDFATHGEDFVSIANEFATTNASTIVDRKDE